MIARFAADTLEFLPGQKFNASATGYYLLGIIVEKVSGQSLDKFTRKNIFVPLGMKHTKLLDKGTIRDAAAGYLVQGDSLVPAPFVHPSLMFGYGNLYSTAGDMMLWEESLRNHTILSRASVEGMEARVAAAGYGEKQATMFGHHYYRYFKGTWGHRMHMLRFPHDSTVILLLTNNNSTRQDKFMRDVASMIYSKYVPMKEIQEIVVDSSILLRYVGNYAFAAGREVAITLINGKLYMQGTNRPRRELAAVSDNRFYVKGTEVYLEFIYDGEKVNELVLHEITTTITAKRVR
jgi:CubicO group peptidase (beta-lactamase class C family)